MAQLAVIDKKEKGMSVPCKALTEELLNAQVAKLTAWLEILLGVKDTKDNVKRIAFLMTHIKEKAWSLSVNQIMDAFKMYIEGRLPLEPMSGFIDATQFNKVINAYKQTQSPKIDNRHIMYSVNDYYVKHKTLIKDDRLIIGALETFDYLYEKGVLPKKDRNEKTIEAYEKMMISAGGYLLAPLIDERKELAESGLAKSPRFKEIQAQIANVRNQTHPGLLPKFKQLVLESYFKKQKRHLREIL